MKKLLFFIVTFFATNTLFAQFFTVGGILFGVTNAVAPFTVEVYNSPNYVGAMNIPTTVTNAGITYSVTSMEPYAFGGSGITSIIFPSSITSIADGAFSNCHQLTFVSIPNSVVSIGDFAFNNCYALASITIPNSVTSIGGAAFFSCTALTSLTIPNSVVSIGASAFFECSALTSITIPNSVTSIGATAFRDCTSLTSVTVKWATPISINANVFENVNLGVATLNVPAGQAAIYDAVAVWTNFGTIYAPPLIPTITSFSPVNAKPGDAVTLTGTNFNTTTTNNVVFFGATRATVTAATATSVTVTVPTGATYAPITLLNTGTSLACNSLKNFTPTYSPAKTSITAADFAAKQDFTSGTKPSSIAVGDLDGDGKPDMAVTNRDSDTVSIYRNTSSNGSIVAGSFAPKIDFITGYSPNSIAIADLDGDGKLDLTVLNSTSNSISVFRNITTTGIINVSSFASKVDFSTSLNPLSITIGDLDGDGKPDLAVANGTAGVVIVYRNTCTSGNITASSFANYVHFVTGQLPYSVAIGDLDGDGKPEMVTANAMSSTISVFRNTSVSGIINASSFASRIDFITGSNPVFVVIGDLDGDNKPDLAVANDGAGSVSIFHNTASSGIINSSSFANNIDFVLGSAARSITIGDMNGDGKPDLAVANHFLNSLAILRNTSTSGTITSGSFATKVDFATGNSPHSLVICDFDGDGKPDLASANSNSNSVSVIRNVSSNNNLSALTISGSTLSPAFATATTNYSANFCDVSGFTLTPTTQDNTATIEVRINGGTFLTVLSASLSQALTLNAGSNTVEVKVTAQNGAVATTTISVNVNIVVPPVAVNQTICVSGTIANLIATGLGIKWYNVSSGGTALPSTTALVTGSYYASQTIGGCESLSRTQIAVTFNSTVPAIPSAISPQVYTTGATLSSLTSSAANPKWYTALTLGVALPTNTILVDGSTYYVSESVGSCESTRTAVVARKISEANQVLCEGATVASLTTSPSAGATPSWFLAPSGGVALSNLEPLTSGNYFIQQAANAGSSSTTLHTAIGSLSDVAVQADGKIVYVDAANSLIKRMNADGTNHITLSTAFVNPSGIAIDADGKILVTSAATTIGRMNADATNIVQLGSGFTLPESIAVQANGKILVINGDDIKRMDADGTNIVTIGGGFFFPLALIEQPDGKILVADSFNGLIKRMDADGLNVVQLGGPNFIFPSSIALQADGKILISDDGVIKRMNADGSNLVTLFSGLQGAIDVAVQADGKIIAAVNGNNSDFSIQRLTEASIATSNRVSVTVTINVVAQPTATPQTFEKYTTTSNLVAAGSNLKWYNVAINGSAVASNTPIFSGTYYVSQTINGCESASRTAVTITVNTATWDGSAWVNSIVPDATKGAVFLGNYSQAANLVAKGVEVIGTSIVTIPSGFDFTINNWIEVASTASLVFENNANLMQDVAATGAIGNITIKRNTAIQRLAYTYWSSPVASQNALAFSPLTLPTRFYVYNEGNNTLNSLTSPETHNFYPTLGYGIRAPNTFAALTTTLFIGTFTGTPHNGNYSFSATKAANGYNLMGNPYPSTMLASAFFTTNPNVQALYFWNNTVLGAPAGHNFATKTSMTAVRATADINSLKVPTDFIGVGQGFFVQVSAPTNVVFNNAMRSSENNPMFFRNAISNKSLFKLNLLSPNNTFNQIAIGYMQGASNGIDNQIDAVPFEQSLTMVSSLINNVDYIIQGRALPFINTDVVPLRFKTDVAGNYSFTTEAFEGVFFDNQNVFLKDNLTNITHNIKQSPYNFTSNVGTFSNRFQIVYQSVLGIENPSFNDNNVFVSVKNDNININSGTTNMKNIQVFDIRGRLVFDKKEVYATQYEIENLKVEQAVLVVKITSEDGTVVTKKIMF